MFRRRRFDFCLTHNINHVFSGGSGGEVPQKILEDSQAISYLFKGSLSQEWGEGAIKKFLTSLERGGVKRNICS